MKAETHAAGATEEVEHDYAIRIADALLPIMPATRLIKGGSEPDLSTTRRREIGRPTACPCRSPHSQRWYLPGKCIASVPFYGKAGPAVDAY
jgi:hypothetical protein